MRLLSLIAIQEQNTALAGQIKVSDAATTAMEAFRQVIIASIKAMVDKVNAEIEALNKLTGKQNNGMGPTPPGFEIFDGGNGGYEGFGSGTSNLGSGNYGGLGGAGRYGGGGTAGSPTFIINASGIGDQQIASVVQSALQDLNRYGNSTTFAGAI
jgi:tetrahydromethanopterin S-methyltransferase subunit B